MQALPPTRSRRCAFTRRQWLTAVGVALTLLALATLETRSYRAAKCAPGCTTCGADLSVLSGEWLTNQSNFPPSNAPAAGANEAKPVNH